jgi:hypothetical protein
MRIATLLAAALFAAATLTPVAASAAPQSAGTSISLRAPRLQAVRAGAHLAVSGVVTGGRSRTVRLELSTPTGWMSVGTTTTTASGHYTVTVPTDWYYAGILRASVVGDATFAAASSPTVFWMRVSPSYRPGGHARQWTLEQPGGQVRWDPCRPITYQVNLNGGPRRALGQIREALRQAHAATGLRFVYAGRTRAIPYRTDHQGPAAGTADLTIGFGTARQVRNLRGSLVGWGGYTSAGPRIVRGAVVLDSQARLRPGFGVGPTWGTLMLHEIGHALGLDHVAERREVMHAGINPSSQGHYQAGDLAGLRRLGAMGGCVPDGPLRSAR